MAKKNISEAKLRGIISESLKNIMRETRSIEEDLETIYKAANNIRNKLSYTQEEGYEPDPETGYYDNAYLYKWAEKVAGDAYDWCN